MQKEQGRRRVLVFREVRARETLLPTRSGLDRIFPTEAHLDQGRASAHILRVVLDPPQPLP